MAKDQFTKRVGIAHRTVDLVTQLTDASYAFAELAAEYAQAGDGSADNYATNAEPQLDNFTLSAILQNIPAAYETWLDQPAYGGGPTRRVLMLGARR